MSDQTECKFCGFPEQDWCCQRRARQLIADLRTELEQARAEAERYRLALEQYADGANWAMRQMPFTKRNLDTWLKGIGVDLARTALGEEEP